MISPVAWVYTVALLALSAGILGWTSYLVYRLFRVEGR